MDKIWDIDHPLRVRKMPVIAFPVSLRETFLGLRDEFITALEANQPAFGLDLANSQLSRLAEYYELVMAENVLLHLVAPCSPEEFAVRHILESLTLLPHLPERAKVSDVGAGAGLPAVPCLLVRDDLCATLVESKQKKARFLNEAIAALQLDGHAEVVNRQFAETAPGNATYVTCRALDRFTDHLPRLLKWVGRRPLLLFGGNNLSKALGENRVAFETHLMPLSEQRYLFVTRG